MASCSIISSWFRLGFRGLSPYSFGILFHHHSLVPARVPGLVSLRGLSPYSFGILFYHHFLVPARVPGLVAQTSLKLNGVLNSFKKQIFSTRLVPGILAFCSTIISSVLLVSGRVPGIVSLVFWHSVPSSCPGSIWFQEGLWGLSPWCCGIVFHHDFLLPSCSSEGSGACFPTFLVFPFSGRGLCSIVIFWFLLVRARVPELVSLLFFRFFSQEWDAQ